MASAKQIDINVITRDGAAGKNQLVAITIDDIVAVYKDGSDVTTIKYQRKNDTNSSTKEAIFKVPETLNAILVKANAQDSNNGLIQVTVTKANGSLLPTPKVQIINRVKIQNMKPIVGGGTVIKLGYKRQTVLEITQNLVTDTASS